MLAQGKRVSYLALCVLLAITLAAHNRVQCATAEKHNDKSITAAAAGVVSTPAPKLAKLAHHLTTGLPLKVTHAPAAAHLVDLHDKSKVASVAANKVTTFAPSVAHPAAAAGSAAAHPAAAHASLMAASGLAVTKAPGGTINTAHSSAKTATLTSATHVSVAQRLVDYFEPICHQVDKLEPKQMFKIQAQMKQFIEKTAGKMSLCFMQHYSIDPNLTPVNKLQLGTICSSRPLGIGVKGSFKNFQACAEQNWDKNLDAELERIKRSCENCVSHSATAPPAPATATATQVVAAKTGHLTAKPALTNSHDQLNVKEATVISDVVSKVFVNNQGALNKTDIKMIDVVPKGAGTVASTTVTNKLPSKEVLNDPNTMVVFVDEQTKTTNKPVLQAATVGAPTKPAVGIAHLAGAVAPPGGVKTAAPAVAPLAGPALAGLLTTLAPKLLIKTSTVTTMKPAVAGVVASNLKVIAISTVAPNVVSGGIKPTSISVAVGGRSGLGDKILSAVSTIEKMVKRSTTAKPGSNKSTTAKSSSGNKGSTTTVAPKKGASTTKKPSGTPTKGGVSTGKQQTTAKAKTATSKSTPAPTGKGRSGHVLPAKVSKAETDAKNAIRALQMQRAQQTHGASDAHLHLMEHQRQMAIDPVGHTIKHQQYEQRKAAAAASAALMGAQARAGKK